MNHPIGSVWQNTDDNFILLVLNEPNDVQVMTTLVLDNGVWPTPAGRRYEIHIDSLHCYYTRIA